ncbi:DUF2189 domain-containing protein [Algoriphagus namhaensis]
MIDPRKADRLLNSPIHFSIDSALRRGWQLFVEESSILVGYTLVFLLIAAIPAILWEDLSTLVSLLISPPLAAGFYLIANRISRGESVEFSNCFDGFKYWLPVIIVNLVTTILTVLGVFALILPGIYLGVAYSFALLFVLFGGADFWTSMELSRKLITKVWWQFFAFVILIVVINLAGVLCLGIGVLVSIPVSYMAIYAAFEELIGDLLVDEEGDLPVRSE